MKKKTLPKAMVFSLVFFNGFWNGLGPILVKKVAEDRWGEKVLESLAPVCYRNGSVCFCMFPYASVMVLYASAYASICFRNASVYASAMVPYASVCFPNGSVCFRIWFRNGSVCFRTMFPYASVMLP